MKAGDKVTLIGIPEKLSPDTQALFEKCLGKNFKVVAMDSIEDLSYPLARLDVGHVNGKASYLETIWVEPQFLKVGSE